MGSTLETQIDSLLAKKTHSSGYRRGDLKPESESTSKIVAAQDQALKIKYYATKILNTETDSKCRLRQHFDETIDHIISACPILAKEKYIKRHDIVCAQLQFNICKETAVQLDKNTGLNMCQNRQKQVKKARKSYCGINKYKLTELFPNNKPDIIIRDNEKGTCMLIDVAI